MSVYFFTVEKYTYFLLLDIPNGQRIKTAKAMRRDLMAHSMQNPTTHFCRGLPRIWQKIVAKMFWKPLKLDTLSKKLLRKHTL